MNKVRQLMTEDHRTVGKGGGELPEAGEDLPAAQVRRGLRRGGRDPRGRRGHRGRGRGGQPASAQPASWLTAWKFIPEILQMFMRISRKWCKRY